MKHKTLIHWKWFYLLKCINKNTVPIDILLYKCTEIDFYYKNELEMLQSLKLY